MLRKYFSNRLKSRVMCGPQLFVRTEFEYGVDYINKRADISCCGLTHMRTVGQYAIYHVIPPLILWQQRQTMA